MMVQGNLYVSYFFFFFFTKCVPACKTEQGINMAFVLSDNISTKKNNLKTKTNKLPSKHTWLLKKIYKDTQEFSCSKYIKLK